MIDRSQVLDLRAQRQRQCEALHPVEFLLPGMADPVQGSSPGIHVNPSLLGDGGFTPDSTMTIRVFRNLCTVVPREKMTLQWRQPGDEGYRTPRMRITNVTAPHSDAIYILTCAPDTK